MLFAIALALASSLPPPPEPEPAPSAPIEQVSDGRVAAETFVNGAGPFRFVIDTGANRTAVSQRLAQALALPPDGQAEVLGVTGTITAPMVRIESLAAGELRASGLSAPLVGAGALGPHDGLLALRDLSNVRVTLDFATDRVSLEPAPRRARRPSGAVSLPARFAAEGVITVPVEVGGVPAVAVLDTGAQYTLINRPLLDRLERRNEAERATEVWVSSIAEDLAAGAVMRMPQLTVAGVAFEGYAALAVDDLHVLREWGLADRPAMIMGMNVMQAMDSLTIDFKARRVYFTYGSQSLVADRRAGSIRPWGVRR